MAETDKLLELTAQIVSAHLSNASIRTEEVAAFIGQVFDTLKGKAEPVSEPEVAPELVLEKPVPAVPVRKSVSPDAIFSLFDGKPYKTLKRHLNGRGVTPEEYRAMFGLPHDYPMVAPNYAAERREIAKKLGLGRKPGQRRGARKAAAK